MEHCEGGFVVYATEERGVRAKWAAEIESRARVRSEFPRNRQTFLGHYGELHHAEV